MHLPSVVIRLASFSTLKFQYPQAGRERTLLLPPPEGKYTHQTLKGQVQMH